MPHGCSILVIGSSQLTPDARLRAKSGPELLTVGHGTLEKDELARLLAGAGIEELVDVRTFPGSRRHPQFDRKELERWLPEAGVGYQWEPRLGGFRRASPESPHTALRNLSFRGYADHMGKPEFGSALSDVVEVARARRTAVMCSESLWWRCHRRLISDATVLLLELPVVHLGHDGGSSAHRLTEGLRRSGELLVYDGGQPRLGGE